MQEKRFRNSFTVVKFRLWKKFKGLNITFITSILETHANTIPHPSSFQIIYLRKTTLSMNNFYKCLLRTYILKIL